MDRLLACRGLRHHTLGPTGARVFGAHLDNALGLRGRFCFRHDREDGLLRDPIVLHVSVNDEQFEGKRAACMWYPSHSLRQTKEHGLGLIEHKFVTWDDVICDVLELTNSSEETLRIGLEVATGAAEMTRLGRDTLAGSRPVGDERVRMLLAMPTTKAVPHQRLVCEITLKPGETTSVLIALAVGHRPGETQAALRSWAQAEDPLARQRRETQEWFARNCPALDCPDERFVRLWWYRWFLLRHNLTRVPASRVPASLREALPEESRAFHEAREGAQSAVRVAGAAHVLQEARWLRDGGFVHEEMRALIAGRSPEGLFRDLPSEADDEQACAEWLPVAMWGALQVWPDEELLGQAADASLKHLACVRERCDPDKNLLLGGGKGPLLADDEAPAAVEEVAHSAMFAASLQATGEMLAQAGRELDSRWHLGLAERCRAAILQQMWDEWDGFFYSLDRASGDPVRVPEAGGFAPFAFGIVPEEGPYGKALALLVDDRHFWTEHPAAQVSVAAGDDAPLAGLTLPYTNSLIAEAMAFAIRRLKQRHVTRRRLMDFLWLRSGVQSEGDDASRLACREVYDAHTGEGYGAYDCLQSCFNDLVIRHLVGVTPMPDGSLEVSPLCTGWEWFALSGVPYRGHTIDVVWDKRSERRREAETPKGLTVYVDGKLVAESPELERLPISFA
jgi:hypothetical protein